MLLERKHPTINQKSEIKIARTIDILNQKSKIKATLIIIKRDWFLKFFGLKIYFLRPIYNVK